MLQSAPSQMSTAALADLRQRLVEMCYVVNEANPAGSRVAIVKFNEPGYYSIRDTFEGPDWSIEQCHREVKYLNDRLGVTEVQAEAMFNGSLFGWHVPSADPKQLDERGWADRIIASRAKKRGDGADDGVTKASSRAPVR